LPWAEEQHLPARLARSIGNYPYACARAGSDGAVKSAPEQPAGHHLVPEKEDGAFRSWPLARLRSMRRGECKGCGNSARREIQIFGTFGIVYVEYGDSTKVYV